MDALSRVFGPARLKALRFFTLHPEGAYEDRELARKLKLSPTALRKELRTLSEAGLIKHKTMTVHTPRGRKRSVRGWYAGSTPLLRELGKIIAAAPTFRADTIVRRFRHTGRIKLIILAGIFIQSTEGPVDILIVGDGLRRASVEAVIRGLEAEIGRELSYALMETHEFRYRLEAYDKFVRDVLDYPHRPILDRVGLPVAP